MITLQASQRETFLLFTNLLSASPAQLTFTLTYYDDAESTPLAVFVEPRGALMLVTVAAPDQLRSGLAVLQVYADTESIYRDEVSVLPASEPTGTIPLPIPGGNLG